ncbi:MAG: hypothetical protein LBT79_01665 [Elusimicrobiota bacterium]|nr:hypothetical protein [Elusimicrobiota bacterium]
MQQNLSKKKNKKQDLKDTIKLSIFDKSSEVFAWTEYIQIMLLMFEKEACMRLSEWTEKQEKQYQKKLKDFFKF